MGVHMDEGEIASLEPQLQKIFKKQLGFFDDEVLSSTLKLINKVPYFDSFVTLVENQCCRAASF
jgi:hypothetical protein